MTENILTQPAAIRLREINGQRVSPPLACVLVFGCQQNEADGERLRGLLAFLGYGMTDAPQDADVVILQTCAVRENAENRVYGIAGAMKNTLKPDAVFGICGCMTQQEEVQEKIKRSYPRVDFVLGTSSYDLLPEILTERLSGRKRTFVLREPTLPYHGEIPYLRSRPPRAWVTIMEGCDNRCTYCIVPYVRGHERSRASGDILEECKRLVGEGYTELYLLGQNVNSYCPEGESTRFPQLLESINSIPGDFAIRFMTSHPKDAARPLFEAIARSEKVSRILHLPVQSGSNRILGAMNRGYTREKYLENVSLARELIPGLTLTSDIIVGFPGETGEDFEDTLDLLRRVGFGKLFTFIYSKRSGTPASEMTDAVPREEIGRRFSALLELQKEIERAAGASAWKEGLNGRF